MERIIDALIRCSWKPTGTLVSQLEGAGYSIAEVFEYHGIPSRNRNLYKYVTKNRATYDEDIVAFVRQSHMVCAHFRALGDRLPD